MKLAEYIQIIGDTVNVVQLRVSGNKKLGLGKIMIQTYHFGLTQVVNNDLKMDNANCMDCPFSYNMNGGKSGGCYTHKGFQLMGVKSMLQYLHKIHHNGQIDKGLTFDQFVQIAGAYNIDLIRFGTYGEPVLLPLDMVQRLAELSNRKKWTGYTHQWTKAIYAPYAAYLMASCHNAFESAIATDMGWRSFIAVPKGQDAVNGVNCPASKEAGKKATCATCALCNGNNGNSKKDIFILQH